ncbi:ROK family transcriptional regulator [Inquilinus sp. Marseille-Q2685]|uniref:ROK family transcriptional regulator n=1 Tax=Inquilinus sp. Marseille-Q2685 TaxID=2866581 RepID=UPI001CE4506C|nr:ROK family transcriptional regulator [Inquilinus sp. Marseille-Q2685]
MSTGKMSGRVIGAVEEDALPSLGTPAEGAKPRPPSLLSPSRMGDLNRGRLLQSLFDLGPTSRADLARHIGVNRATITGIVQPLIDDGILVEGEPASSGGAGGKPARPLQFSRDAPQIGAVALSHGSVRTALVSWTGEISALERAAFPTDGGDPGQAVAAVAGALAHTLSAARQPPLGIGVAAAGMIDRDRGVIVKVNLAPVLSGLALGAELEERTGLPVYLDHHPRALLLADRWFGTGRSLRTFAVLYLSDVIGGALQLDGHLQSGPAGAGGELGHTFVQIDGEICACGRRGCWETVATIGWLRRQAQAAGLPGAEEMTPALLAGLAEAGSGAAERLLDLYARNIAVGIANLQQTLAPNHFVLHGEVVEAGERLRAAIEAHVGLLVPPRPGSEPRVLLTDQRGLATLRGAAGIVLSRRLQFQL